MTISSGDVKLLKSQVLLDTSDGGGAMTGVEVVDGQSNNLFPDISELDRTYGRIALRKTFASVLTSNTDSYYGAHAIISKMPTDPRVAITLFSTDDWFDRRDNAQDHIERYLARGPKWAGHVLEMQLEGQRAIQLAVQIQDGEPKVGQGLVLVQDEGKPSEYEQYLRVTKVTSIERTFTVQGHDVVRKVLTVEISDPLRYNFEGLSVEAFETVGVAKAVCRDTLVANAATYYGISALTQGGHINDASVQVENIFTQLVPSATSETPMVDLTASGMSNLYVPGNTVKITVSTSAPISPSTKLYLGTPIMPGSLILNAGGNVVTDLGGLLHYNEVEVGTIEYDKGLLNWNTSVFTHYGSKQITFMPAATPHRVADTAAISIVQDTRGYNYTITLLPVPMPASLSVSYMAQGDVYYLYDNGAGILRGSDPAFGTGSIDYVTGSVILTTGALPDANSEIIFAWGKGVLSFTRADIVDPPSYFEFTLGHPQVAPGQVQITWMVGVAAKSAADDGNGNLVGDATGTINYGSGIVKIIPTLLVQKGTEFTVVYQWGPPNEQIFNMPTRDGNGDVSITIPGGGGLVPKSVELVWNVDIINSPMLDTTWAQIVSVTWNPPPLVLRVDPLVQGFDNGDGTIRRADGAPNPGVISYSTGQITFTPDFALQIPLPEWTNVFMGSVTQVIGAETRVIDVWRNAMSIRKVNTIATMPFDEKGVVTVRWRMAGGTTAATEIFAGDTITFDITPGYAETILQGSVRFTCGGLTYVDRLGSLYHSIDPQNGSGTAGGTIQYQSGSVDLTSWVPGTANSLTLQSLVTEVDMDSVDEVVFRVPIAPVRSGSVQIRAVPLFGGAQVSVTADSQGNILGNGMIGSIDYTSGVVRIRFGVKHIVDDQIRAKSWYSVEAEFTEGGIQKIIEPKPVYPDSIRFNAVGFTYLPLSAAILGLDPVRLPSDGRVPTFRTSDVVVIHNTQTTAFSTGATIGTTLDVSRVRLSYLKVYDSTGVALDPTMYTVDLDGGIVTLNSSFVLGSLVEPLLAEHRIEDMSVVTDTQINGRLSLNRPLTHEFPANSSYASSSLVITDMQSRAYGKFSQNSWTSVWSDSIIGSPIIPQFNDVQYPITVTNKGSAEEKWAIIFTSTTAFRVIGKSLGQIAVGDTSTDCAPLNPATNAPYFTLQALGWGGGWSAGNVLRFNTAGANYPIWIARTVQQGPATALTDSFQLQLRGDIDR